MASLLVILQRPYRLLLPVLFLITLVLQIDARSNPEEKNINDGCSKLELYIRDRRKCFPCTLCRKGEEHRLYNSRCRDKNPDPISHMGGRFLWCDSPGGTLPECPAIDDSALRNCSSQCRAQGRKFAPGCQCIVGCPGENPVSVYCTIYLQWNSSDIPQSCPSTGVVTMAPHQLMESSANNPVTPLTPGGQEGGIDPHGIPVHVIVGVVVGVIAIILVGIFICCCIRKKRHHDSERKPPQSESSSEMSGETGSPLLGKFHISKEGGKVGGDGASNRWSGSSKEEATPLTPAVNPTTPVTQGQEEQSMLGYQQGQKEAVSMPDSDVGRDTCQMQGREADHGETKVQQHQPCVIVTSAAQVAQPPVLQEAEHRDAKVQQYQPCVSFPSVAEIVQSPELQDRSLPRLVTSYIMADRDESCRALRDLMNSRQDVTRLVSLFDQKPNFDRLTWHTVATDLLGWDRDRVYNIEYRMAPRGSPHASSPMYQVLEAAVVKQLGLLDLLHCLQFHGHAHGTHPRKVRNLEAENFLNDFWFGRKQGMQC